MVDVIVLSRGFGHARLIHFFFDPREKRLVGFVSWLILMHAFTMSRVQMDYRSIGNRADSCGIIFPAEQFCSVRTAQRNLASYNAQYSVSLTRSDAWTIEDEQCQKIGGGYEAAKFRFLLFL